MVRSRTVIAVPPGATIKEQLNDRSMNQKEFASRMGMSEKHISNLINGAVQLTPDVAMRLEMVLGIPARFWNNLEAIYREDLARAQAENNMDADLEIVKKLPYNEMAKNGWVENTRNPKERVMSARKFFEVVNLGLLHGPLIPGIACRKLGCSDKSDYALVAWAQEAKREARNISVQPINIGKLKTIIPSIREMTMQDPKLFCPALCQYLRDCGVALVFLPHIGGSFLHGASFYDGPKIVVGMTARGKDADRFWFSLLHELGHVVLGHIGQADGTSQEDEDNADMFAREILIPEEDFSRFVSYGRFDKASIREFASNTGIHPGIVVGRLQKENIIPFNQCNDLKDKYAIVS